jgi:hypothetical protein
MQIVGAWTHANKSQPCPVCGKLDWCAMTSDGTLVACRRVEVGAWRTKIDGAGCLVFLHRLNDGRQQIVLLPSAPPRGPQRATPEILHTVYSHLLARLPLSRQHRNALHGRGLSDAEIDRRGYRSLPALGRSSIARTLFDRHGDQSLMVPGIVSRERDGRRYSTVAGPVGLLVPCRDLTGQIVALKVRRNDPVGDRPRYVYVSSRQDGGPGPGTPVHCPAGTPETAEVVRLTEGELKADVAFALSGTPTVSVPGVGCWRPALAVLHRLRPSVVRLAFDSDYHTNAHVGRALAACAQALGAAGFHVELERWPAEHKGIDDALAAGAVPDVLANQAMIGTAMNAQAMISGARSPASTPARPPSTTRRRKVMRFTFKLEVPR